MPPRGDLGLATGLRSVADSATSAAVAVLTVIAVVVLAYGLGRAIIRNRRPQIVVADIACSGNAELAEASALSQVVRRCIRGQIDDQRSQVARIGQSILLPASRALDIRLSEVERIQHAATDSVSAVLSTLRAVAPGSADRFINMFALILPPPRGITVNVAVIRRGTAAAPRLGACAELNMLDGRLLSSAVFWEPAFPAPVAIDGASAAERVLALLEPVTRWVAVHLVLTLMVSPRRRIPRKTQQGLRRLLAGGLFLQAMRDYFPDHAPAFGEEALTELEQARLLLPQTPLAVTTLAGVHERIGWAQRGAGQPEQALDAFRAAVRAWRDAERLTAATAAADDASRALVVERRLKAQLASGDAVLSAAALAELRADSLLAAHPAGRAWRYNRACLYAQAYRADPLTEYLELALKWLGLALLREMDSSLWEDARQRDPELTPVREALSPFLLDLRAMIPVAPDTMSETDAEELVARVMQRHSHALCAGLLLWCRMYLRVRGTPSASVGERGSSGKESHDASSRCVCGRVRGRRARRLWWFVTQDSLGLSLGFGGDAGFAVAA
jgi:hypothetical protein